MTNSIESILIFEDYFINNMEYKRNPNYVSEEEIEVAYEFAAHAKFNEKKDGANITITCNVFGDEFIKGEAPFTLTIGITGNFKVEGEIDIEGFQMNGMAILLPYLRSVVTSFTSQSGIAPVILPTINVYNAFQEESTKMNPD